MTKLKKQLAICLGSSFILGACSTYHPMEATYDKMSRYDSKRKVENTVPHITATPVRLGSRGPASASSMNLKSKVDYTNKQLYFITLYSQYHELANYSTTSTPELKSCPGLHSAWLTYKSRFAVKPVKKKLHVNFTEDTEKWNPSYVSKYPEMSLPITFETARPTVADIVKSSKAPASTILQQAINTHVTKTYREIKQLCDIGVSDNYYAYENLANDLNRKRLLRASKENMDTLFKITVFSNMSIINSLKEAGGRSIASKKENVLEHENFVRFKAPWVKEFFKAQKKFR